MAVSGGREPAELTAGAVRWRAAGPLSPPGPGAGGTTYRRSGGQKRSVMAASKASSVCREKHRRTRVVALRMTVDCCSPAAHAAVGEWDGAEPGPALRLRRGHLQSVVSSPCRSSRAVAGMNVCLGGTVRAAAARQRIFAPVTNRGEPNCYAGCPANRQPGMSRRRRNAGFALAQPLLRWPQSWRLGFRLRQAERLVRELPPGRCTPGCTAGQKPGRPRSPGLASLVSPILDLINDRTTRVATMKRSHPSVAADGRRRDRACGAASPPPAAAAEEGLQHRLVDLCRLDAVALCGRSPAS